MRTLISVLGVILLATAGAYASDELSYNYAQATYIDVELDEGPSGDGFGLNGSFELGDFLHLFAGYNDVGFDEAGIDLDLTTWTAGVGYHRGVGDRASLFAEVGYVDAEIDTFLGDVSDDGYSAALGVRGLVHPKVELSGAITYIDLSDSGDDTSFTGGVLVNLTRVVSVGAAYTTSDDADQLSAGVRFYWGR